MRILSAVLIALYAALNLLLAVAGMFVLHRESPFWQRAVPCGLFALAATLLVAGLASRTLPLVIVGLLLASVAPVVYGHLVEHSNVLLHHLVRAVVAVGIGALWAAAWRTS